MDVQVGIQVGKKQMKHGGRAILGSVFVLVALAGYLTVADDLRHLGEFLAVTGLLVSGIALLVSSRFPKHPSIQD